MNKTELYLSERYNKTKWPYFTLNQVKFDVGESFDSEVKDLRKREMIKPTPGINGWLIEMINLNKWIL